MPTVFLFNFETIAFFCKELIFAADFHSLSSITTNEMSVHIDNQLSCIVFASYTYHVMMHFASPLTLTDSNILSTEYCSLSLPFCSWKTSPLIFLHDHSFHMHWNWSKQCILHVILKFLVFHQRSCFHHHSVRVLVRYSQSNFDLLPQYCYWPYCRKASKALNWRSFSLMSFLYGRFTKPVVSWDVIATFRRQSKYICYPGPGGGWGFSLLSRSSSYPLWGCFSPYPIHHSSSGHVWPSLLNCLGPDIKHLVRWQSF